MSDLYRLLGTELLYLMATSCFTPSKTLIKALSRHHAHCSSLISMAAYVCQSHRKNPHLDKYLQEQVRALTLTSVPKQARAARVHA